MKRIRVLILAILLTNLSQCTNQDTPSYSGDLEKDLSNQLNNYVNSSSKTPGAWLSVSFEDNETIDLVSGFSNNSSKEELTIDHSFRIASVSKVFTATVILQLVEENNLSLNDLITEYLDANLLAGLHDASKLNRITIQMLLQHTSGIDNYVELDWVNTLLSNPSRFWNPEDLLRYVEDNGGPKNDPGNSFYYSDTNYVLLGLIIEQITEKSLHKVYHERIIDPLQMNDTYLEAYENPDVQKLAHGYYDNSDLFGWNTSSDWSAGGLVSTTQNLSKFLRALVSNELFNNASTFSIMKDWLSTGGNSYYGLGLGQYTVNNTTIIGHGGQGFGFTSGLYYYPDKDVIICVAVNQQATNIDNFEKSVINTINYYK